MTKITANPWDAMLPNSVRRIDSEISHNLFWMIDQMGNYGFYLKTTNEFLIPESDIKLRGISIIKRNLNDVGELFLILNKQNDWELFLSLCIDLISVCSISASNEKMVIAVENRLKRWQSFLIQNTEVSLSLMMQMGLFAELTYLKEYVLPARGASASLLAWGGPEADKQDFSFPDLSVEVKSYKTSKSPQISISSAHQLFSGTKPLYIVAFGLTEAEHGQSIVDLINELEDLFSEEPLSVIQSFEQKLIEFGYMPGMHYHSIYKFVCDNIRAFAVVDDFPSILPHQIPAEIISVNYSIDLQLCVRFEKSLNDIL